MRDFLIKTACVSAVVLLLAVYNQTLDNRDKNEQILQLMAQVNTLEIQAAEYTDDANSGESRKGYADGCWTGEAQGFGGTITVEVTVETGSISGIEIVSADGEDGAYLSMAESIIPQIIEAQTSEVDTVSGATFSSTGIRDAVAEALKQAAGK